MNKNHKNKHAAGQHVLGIDVSKATFDAGVAGPDSVEDLRSIGIRAYPRTIEGARECLEAMGRSETIESVVMEATGSYSQELAVWLRECRPDLPVFIANPLRIKRFGEYLGVRTKTDAQDARVIACYGVGRRFWPSDGKAPDLQEIDRLHKDRDALVQMVASEHQHMSGSDRCEMAREVHRRVIQELEAAILDLDKAIHELVNASADLSHQVELLESIPGIGFQTATKVLAAVGDLLRFERSRELSAFVGLAPQERLSGTSVHGRTRLSKKGNPRVRKALCMAAMTAMCKAPFQTIYQRLVDKGKTPKAALGALMRRLLVIMRAVLKSGIPFDPDLLGRRPSTTAA